MRRILQHRKNLLHSALILEVEEKKIARLERGGVSEVILKLKEKNIYIFFWFWIYEMTIYSRRVEGIIL